MSCFQRIYRNRKGKEQQSKNYTVQFTDHAGIVRRVTAVPNKSASESIERSILKLVSLRIAGIAPDVESARFLESCLPEIRKNLADWKIITGERAAAGQSIDQHIGEWVEHMRSKDATPKHIKEFRGKVEKLKTKYKWSNITDITTANVKDYINYLRDKNRAAATISGKQFDFHAWRGQLATLLNQSGTPLVTAQRIMRHSDPKLTANMYTDVFEEDKAKELAKIPSTSISTASGPESQKSGEAPEREAKSADTKADTKHPNSDGQIRTYANENEVGKNAVLQLLERFPELQHLYFDRDKGAILLFPPAAQGKMAIGHEETLIPQEDKGSKELAPPAGFFKP